MYIIMSCFFVLLCGIHVLRVTSINVTNNGNQQDIIDMKKDIVMLRNLVTGMNTTIYTQQQEMRSMNTTIYTQQQEMRSMNVTIHVQQQEIAYLIGSAQAQEQKTALIESETKEVVRAMNSTIQAQQQIEELMNETIQDQQHKIANMESTIQILKQDNRTFNEEVEVLRKNNSAEIEHLKAVDTKRNQNYEAFQIVVQDLVTNVNTLRNTSQLQIGGMNDSLTSLARQIHYTSLSFLDAQKMLKELENAMKERNRTYAFTVSTSSSLTNYNDKKIVYDKVITNKGGTYNSNTGIFTCSSPGTYVFTWSTMSNSATQFCKAYIYHNGNQLLLTYSNGGYYEAASNTILLTLTVGDHVWIQTTTGTYCHGYPYTAFSGWKI